MAKLCLAVGLLFFFLEGASASEWEKALSFLEEGKAAEAIPLLENQRALEESTGKHAPAIEHALATAYLRLEQWSPACTHLLRSAFHRTDPLYALTALRALSRVQHRLMIPDAVSDHWPLQFRLLFSRSFLTLFTLAAGWVFLFSFFVKTHGRFLARLGGVLFLVGGILWGLHASLSPAAVLQEKAALFSRADTSSEVWVELPAGTVVTLGKKMGELRELAAPFAGWVEQSKLQIVD
jgi:hypothetical protein